MALARRMAPLHHHDLFSSAKTISIIGTAYGGIVLLLFTLSIFRTSEWLDLPGFYLYRRRSSHDYRDASGIG
ncbi:hypothetical protein EMIT0P43_20293 [Pseudomonas jessenii]